MSAAGGGDSFFSRTYGLGQQLTLDAHSSGSVAVLVNDVGSSPCGLEAYHVSDSGNAEPFTLVALDRRLSLSSNLCPNVLTRQIETA